MNNILNLLVLLLFFSCTAKKETSKTNSVKEFEDQYQQGLITQGEKYNKVVDVWSKCSDDVAAEMMKNISKIS